MTTNDIERAVNALLELSGRLVRSIAEKIEATSKAVDSNETPEPVYVETLLRCAYCKAPLKVKTGHSPFEAWICQACARTWHNWDGITPTVAARLRVTGAGDRR
ncbi:Uncharacterised protein [Mycobacteroides abscessus]|uniref:hypothetical protein n=1 Tax=Mycobacteroides abscessus TaxID=36809 RepID=UPI0005E3B60E|nr:hypothetical protein [Mycobacteroides abscessus]CPX18469.1 Uncharacterised protein [Mycobacteroides abscessus]CRG60449.1 Uncharacterised protein [Mycobacteroides abscessus]